MNRQTKAAIQRIAPMIMAQLQTVRLELSELEPAVRESSIYDQVHVMRLEAAALSELASIVQGASMGGRDD